MRNCAHALATPPVGLSVSGDASYTGLVSSKAIAGLDGPMIVSGREVPDRLTVGGFDHSRDVGGDHRTTGKRAQIDRFQMCEEVVWPFDIHDRLVGRDAVALFQSMDLQSVPARNPA